MKRQGELWKLFECFLTKLFSGADISFLAGICQQLPEHDLWFFQLLYSGLWTKELASRGDILSQNCSFLRVYKVRGRILDGKLQNKKIKFLIFSWHKENLSFIPTMARALKIDSLFKRPSSGGRLHRNVVNFSISFFCCKASTKPENCIILVFNLLHF